MAEEQNKPKGYARQARWEAEHPDYFKNKYRTDPEFRAKILAKGARWREKHPHYSRDYMRARRAADPTYGRD